VNILQRQFTDFCNTIPPSWRVVDGNTTQQEQKGSPNAHSNPRPSSPRQKIGCPPLPTGCLTEFVQLKERNSYTYVTTGPLSPSRSSERTCETVHYIPLTASFGLVEPVPGEASNDNHVRIIVLQHLTSSLVFRALHCTVL
jgi:hypothetical protein